MLSTHGRDASAHQILRKALSNSELLTFSEIQDGGRHHLGFLSRVTRVHVNSVVLELYIKLM